MPLPMPSALVNVIPLFAVFTLLALHHPVTYTPVESTAIPNPNPSFTAGASAIVVAHCATPLVSYFTMKASLDEVIGSVFPLFRVTTEVDWYVPVIYTPVESVAILYGLSVPVPAIVVAHCGTPLVLYFTMKTSTPTLIGSVTPLFRVTTESAP